MKLENLIQCKENNKYIYKITDFELTRPFNAFNSNKEYKSVYYNM